MHGGVLANPLFFLAQHVEQAVEGLADHVFVEGFFDALVRMFEQALKLASALSVDRRDDLVARLDRVRAISAMSLAMALEMTWIFSFRSSRGAEADRS